MNKWNRLGVSTKMAGERSERMIGNDVELRQLKAELNSGRPLGFSRPRQLKARIAELERLGAR